MYYDQMGGPDETPRRKIRCSPSAPWRDRREGLAGEGPPTSQQGRGGEVAEAAEAKPALAVYCAEKTSIGKELFYENSTGSGLLFEARSGMLRTRQLRAKYTAGLDITCPNCGLDDETVRHIVLECPELRPPPSDGAALSLAMALGFRGRGEQPSWQAVETSKRRLELWWRIRASQTHTPTASTQVPRVE
ncbi:hypothetical protein HPB48_016737 [Haemaphysalis longicornis]|uniref:Tick transposon n=1 Tax=Haemaphysalis longicornis TaxID=44386 RepID=A0A9J6FSC0_HAELO|nr:hypothetical protein HPB48_016737 [Haemaphysalis longicornis]